jgi:hypothetical protein
MSGAAPPAFKSVAQRSAAPAAMPVTVLISSSSAVSSLSTFVDSSTSPCSSSTTQWWDRFPASIPAQILGMFVSSSSSLRQPALTMTVPTRP